MGNEVYNCLSTCATLSELVAQCKQITEKSCCLIQDKSREEKFYSTLHYSHFCLQIKLPHDQIFFFKNQIVGGKIPETKKRVFQKNCKLTLSVSKISDHR